MSDHFRCEIHDQPYENGVCRDCADERGLDLEALGMHVDDDPEEL